MSKKGKIVEEKENANYAIGISWLHKWLIILHHCNYYNINVNKN